MWKLERACRQSETARSGSAFQSQRTDGRNTGCGILQEWLPFHGSKVDRRFSYSKIDAALQRNRYGERMNLIPKVCTTDTPNATSDTARGELVSGSLGLLNGHGSSCNATDAEANLEMAEMLRRKKKRKKGLRL